MNMPEAALAYAAKGWPIFPCRSDKTPFTENGVNDATTDPAQIERWWKKWPKANIALNVGEAGMMVLDYDPGADRAELERHVGKLPQTKLVAATPRGGTHEYYALAEGEIVPNSASKLAAAVDVRSFHGYVLLPPSRTSDGVYDWVSAGRPAHRSDELRRVASIARDKSADRDNWLIDPDLDENVAACIKWLREDAKISVEGRGGDANAYATAAMCKSFGISEELAFDLMWEHWNPRCSPPWSPEEADHLEAKVRNGYSYNTSPPGNMTQAYRVAKAGQDFKPVTRETSKGGHESTAGRFRFVDRAGMEDIPPASWLIQDVLTDGGQAILFGAPGTFKTFVALDMALSLATGFPEDSVWSGRIVKPGPVLFAVGEGRSGLTKRVHAWERLHWGGEQVRDFVLADPVPSASIKALDSGEWDAFIDGALELQPNGYALVVVDTIGRAMQGLNENAQEHASGYSRMVEHLRRHLCDTVLGLHHVGLDHTDRERGSNVFAADADTRLRLERAAKERVVRLTLVKQKEADDSLPPWLIKLQRVELAAATDKLPAIDSLAATVPDAGAQFNVAEKEARKEASRAIDQINLTVIDNALMDVLSANKLTDWTTRALALELSRQEGVNITAKTLQNRYLPELASNKLTRAFHCFQSKPAPRWKWVQAPN